MPSNRILVPLVVLLFIGYFSVFSVHQTQKAIKFRLGEIVSTDFEPGLHFKWPIYNNVKLFDARILTLDSNPERFLTKEKKNVIVDSFVKWRINNAGLFYTTVEGDALQANLRLDQIMKDAMRGAFSKRKIKELIATDRNIVRDTLISKTQSIAKKLGIEIVDVQIKRIDLPREVSTSVYRRMEAERARVARGFRSRGAEAAERIRADADKQREIILANAYRDAETVRGAGDSAAADIYAKTYNKNEEFYSFYRSLNAYRRTFRKSDDLIVLDPDSDFFKYFKSELGK